MRAILTVLLGVLLAVLLGGLFSRLIAPFGCDNWLCIPMCTPTDTHICPIDARNKLERSK